MMKLIDELAEANIEIAKMMGWKETTTEFKIKWLGCVTEERLLKTKKEFVPILEKDNNVMFSDSVYFANDWDWLMSAVSKVESKGYNVIIRNKRCEITDELGILMVEYVGDTKIGAVVKSITAISKYINNQISFTEV